MPRPRFLILGTAPIFGSRDEYVGLRKHVHAVAETPGWAKHQANLLGEEYGEFTEFGVEIAEWNGTYYARWYGERGELPVAIDTTDLPF